MTEMETGSPRRRGLLIGGVAAAAALAGAGLAWRKQFPGAQPAQSEEVAELWRMSFDTPAGTRLDMQTLRGKPLLLNFWATWCPPCVEEMPMLDAFYKQSASKNWQVVGLAIDQPTAVRTWLGRTPVTFPIGLAGLGGSELSRNLGNLAGALPFTIVIGAAGNVLQRKMGRVTTAELAQWQDMS